MKSPAAISAGHFLYSFFIAFSREVDCVRVMKTRQDKNFQRV
jgi:hypothetical protein